MIKYDKIIFITLTNVFIQDTYVTFPFPTGFELNPIIDDNNIVLMLYSDNDIEISVSSKIIIFKKGSDSYYNKANLPTNIYLTN